jgi:LuxR family transcriptional regulator, maltose regulon positive regulatory protein
MRSLVRDELRCRFAGLPLKEQSEPDPRASLRLAERGMAEAAAFHALASGASEPAYELGNGAFTKP